MLGIILCGGHSSRMGTDKGLMSHNDEIWAKLAGNKISTLDVPHAFSVNEAQRQSYANSLNEDQLIIDQPGLDVNGPLRGVLSAHLQNPSEDLFLLACDMVLMEGRILKLLSDAYHDDNSFDAYIYNKGGEQEPLCGIYKAAGLEKIVHKLQATGLEKHSMKFVLSQLIVCELIVEEQDYKCFMNFNAHAEINGL